MASDSNVSLPEGGTGNAVLRARAVQKFRRDEGVPNLLIDLVDGADPRTFSGDGRARRRRKWKGGALGDGKYIGLLWRA
jgi:hypothetical protein